MVRSRTFSAWGYRFVFLCFGFFLVDPVDEGSNFPFYNRKTEKPAKCNKVFYFFQLFALFSMFSYFPLRFYTCEMVRKNPVIVVITGFRWCG